MPDLSHLTGISVRNGNLCLSGIDLVSLAKEFGTPLYVLSEDLIRDNCRRYQSSFRKMAMPATAAYAGKAFLTTGMCGLLKSEGMGLDVCSAGELYTAQAVGFPMKRVLFHGNGKTPQEIAMGLDCGVGRFVVDNLHELHLLNELAAKAGKIQPIFFRVTPGVQAHTHEHVQTGHLDTKFGLGIENGQAETAIRTTADLPHVRLLGLHCHIGSQLFDLPPFEEAIGLVLTFMNSLRPFFPNHDWELDLGGGLGIRYTAGDAVLTIEEYVRFLVETTRRKTTELGLSQPHIWIEPGRSIVGPAGVTLYSVGAVKHIPDIRTYVAVDGSMADHPRTALYDSVYTAVLANKADRPTAGHFAVAGKACESGDMIIRDTPLADPVPGDLLAVFCTGAYHYSMSSNYNRLVRPPVIGLADGASRVLVKGETFAELVRNDLNPYR